MKVDYDLTLTGYDLYHENLKRWHKAHRDADSLAMDKRTGDTAAIYKCPTREDFEAMKQVDALMKVQTDDI